MLAWLALAAVAGPALSGCGYRALYAQNKKGGVGDGLSQVSVASISDRSGQHLRNRLLDRMRPPGAAAKPKYRLAVTLNEQRQELGVRKDETRTRANLVVTADYNLVELARGRIVFRAVSRRIASFNISDRNFSTISAEAAARRRALDDVGDDIVTRLALFLYRQRPARR